MKDEEFKNIDINDAVKELHQRKAKILEDFAKAYLAETQLMPGEIELVTQQMPMANGIIENIYFFRKRTT